jgi:hypothetical protein
LERTGGRKFSRAGNFIRVHYKRLLAAVLTAAVVIGCGLFMTGASCAAAFETGDSSAGDTLINAAGGSAVSAAIDTQSESVHRAYITGYPDGEVKPLDQLTREEAAAIFYRLMAAKTGGAPAVDTTESPNIHTGAATPFTDVGAGRWSNDAITALYNAGVIQGYGDGSFQPYHPITRAEFAAIAARFANLCETQENQFKDQRDKSPDLETKSPDIENHWAAKYINSAAEKGWVRAYGDLTFRPENTILRCEAMMWINDAQNRIVNAAGLCAGARQWPDNTQDKWYYEIVLEAGNTHVYERIADRPKSTEKWIDIEENPVRE